MTEAIVLCGGFGTRLRSVYDGPKCMAPIDGKPFLAYLVDWLKKQGISRIILAVGYKKEAIMDYFGDSVEYSIEDEPLGTGGAVAKAFSKLNESAFVFVLNGDSFIDISLNDMEIAFWERGRPIVMAVTQTDSLSFKNAGVYLLEDSPKMPESSFSLEEYIKNQANKLPEISLVISTGFFVDIGTPEGYEKAKRELKNYVK